LKIKLKFNLIIIKSVNLKERKISLVF